MLEKSGKPSFLSVIGPTASGKSSLAFGLAKALGAELVNCDSVQVYRGFDVGAAKPSLTERESVPHHLLDCVAWDEEFDASKFASMARARILEINQRGKLAIVVGGSGLYLRFLWGQSFHELPSDSKLRAELNSRDLGELYQQLESLDPQRAKQLHPRDKFRVTRALEINILSGKTVAEMTGDVPQKAKFLPVGVIFINRQRSELHSRIAKRAETMLEQGLIDEVSSLLANGCPKNAKPMQSIGYKQVVEYLHNHSMEKAELLERIIVATRRYAKRQLTWYQKVPYDIALENSEITSSLIEKIRGLTTKQS